MDGHRRLRDPGRPVHRRGVPEVTLDDLFTKYGELLHSPPMEKVAFYIPEATFRAVKEAMRRPKMEDKALLKLLEEQVKKYCSDFIFYDIADPPRQGPVVTIYVAELKPEEGGGFARAVSICTMRDTPGRVKGRIEAAKRLLRAIKNGVAIMEPTEEEARDVAEKLCHLGLIEKGDASDSHGHVWINYIGGDCGVQLSADEQNWWTAHKENLAKHAAKKEQPTT